MRHAVPAGVNEKAAQNRMPKLGTDLAVPDAALETMMAAYAAGVSDVPGTLGPLECANLLREAAGLPAGPVRADALEAAVSEVERTLGTRGPGDDASPAGLDARIQSLWDRLELPRRFEYATFGHIGDNHVHVNILPKTPIALQVARRLYDVLTRQAIALGGTVSGEHGIGKIKRHALRRLLGDDALAQMAAVKHALDPRGILGVGNLLEPSAPAA
jgi:FAD/FMN-containing dehydrogenase